MDQPLDLSITLTSPPQDSSPETIAGLSVQCETLNLTHSGDLLINPLTEKEREELRWYLEEFWKWPYLEFAARGRRVEALLIDVGKRLYRAVFGNSEAQALLQPWQDQRDAQLQISIVSELPGVLSLPWELLHDKQGFLALHPDHPISIVRRLPQPEQATLATSFEPPLRILLITSRPERAGFVDPRSIARELVDEVQEHVDAGIIELEFLRPATLAALHMRLQDTQRPVHIVHFDGHGAFNEQRGQGLLAFENEKGGLALVSASELAEILSNRGVRLVVLTACHTAKSSTEDAFSSVATQLLQGGIDAVVAMSTEFLVTSATRYVEAFYRAIAAGTPGPMAQEQARSLLYKDPRRHLSHRRVDEEGAPIELHDWWVPHFYQQRSVLLIRTKASYTTKQQAPTSPVPRLNQEMPIEPRYGFRGRARELLKIERALLLGKLVIISGFGGVGKTALAREAADWLTRTGMYNGACFVSFEHDGDAALLLRTLGSYLGVNNSNYNPTDQQAALRRLRPVLKKKHIMVIADSLESMLPWGEAPLDEQTRRQLWDVLLKLAKAGSGIVLTSRDTNFRDRRLARRSKSMLLELKALHPEDAYILASQLLAKQGIDRVRAPYSDLLGLLAQLDYHPLAIELVLPVLREIPLSNIKADFAALLPLFKDDTATGRNRSLTASLNYSLQRFSTEQRVLLPRLSLFEGGANENNFLAITRLTESEWAPLLTALKESGLITLERIHKDSEIPFLHFHPILVPFLRKQNSLAWTAADKQLTYRYQALADYLYLNSTLRELYIRLYATFADNMYLVDSLRSPLARALVRKEFPNLLRTLELLLQENRLAMASELAAIISKFLNNFGRVRESEELQRKVSEAIAMADFNLGETLIEVKYRLELAQQTIEREKDDLPAAQTRLKNLLTLLEAQPKDSPLGPGSYGHCVVLGQLATCLYDSGQFAEAWTMLQKALAGIDVLLKEHPDSHVVIDLRAALVAEVGNMLSSQGQYSQAKVAFEESLRLAKQRGNIRGQVTALMQLGDVALDQRNYTEARLHFTSALALVRAMNEPSKEASIWRSLGQIAKEQEDWPEAENCNRESVKIYERLGDEASTSVLCNDIASVALAAGRPIEAEGWLRRSLELDERLRPESLFHANHLTRLSSVLLQQMQEEHASKVRLSEACNYAERALAIMQYFKETAHIWVPLHHLADIADLEGNIEMARDYRRQEREAFASFPANRAYIDRLFRQQITFIALAAKGDVDSRTFIEGETLPKLEAQGWHRQHAVRRILAGERDWQSLAEDLDDVEALIILRVLNLLAMPSDIEALKVQDVTREQIIATLPRVLRRPWEEGDGAEFNRALKAVSLEDLMRFKEAFALLQKLEKEEKEDSPLTGEADKFKPLLEVIADTACGDGSQDDKVETVLDELEKEGEKVKEVMKRILTGDRSLTELTVGLSERETELVERVLEMIAERTQKPSPAAEVTKDRPKEGKLTPGDWLYEYRLGEREFERGNYHDASNRFMTLLARIETLAEGSPVGLGSYEHCWTLVWFARCLKAGGLFAIAEQRVRQALVIIDGLLRRQPNDQSFNRTRGILLFDLGNMLRSQGRYSEAQQAYEEGLQIAKEQGDLEQQVRDFSNLGALALERRHYIEARTHYTTALNILRTMDEQTMDERALEAIVLRDLSMVALEQENLSEAKEYTLQSLSLNEQLGYTAEVAALCNRLGDIYSSSDLSEAEKWYKRALEFVEKSARFDTPSHAGYLTSLAALLTERLQGDRIPKTRLSEARGYAMQALTMRERFDAQEEIWKTLGVLADIADLEEKKEEAKKYRRRERETYAAFEGNRYDAERKNGDVIKTIVASTNGNEQMRAVVKRCFLDSEREEDQHLGNAIQRIWQGERDWYALAENLVRDDALVVLMALEMLAQEKRVVIMDVQEMLRRFESLLQSIAKVAIEDKTSSRDVVEVETILTELEKEGWQLRKAVQRIWRGERNIVILTEGLNTQEKVLVLRVLNILSQPELLEQHNRANELFNLGEAAQQQGQYSTAVRRYEEALALFEQVEDQQKRADVLQNLGIIRSLEGQLEEAQHLYNEALIAYTRSRDLLGQASILQNLGSLAFEQEQFDKAQRFCTEALTRFEQIGHEQGRADNLERLGDIADSQGNKEEAQHLYSEAIAAFEKLKNQHELAFTQLKLGQLLEQQAQIEEAQRLYNEALTLFEQQGNQQGSAISLGLLGSVAFSQNNYAAALQYLLQALAIFKQMHSPNSRAMLSMIAEIQAKVGEATFNDLWQGVSEGQPLLSDLSITNSRQDVREGASVSSPIPGILTHVEYQHESDLGEKEFRVGNIRAAYARFLSLLQRIETQPGISPLARGSWAHYQTLLRVARCLESSGHPSAAQDQLNRALAVIEALMKQEPSNQDLIKARGGLLTDLGDVLRAQGEFDQARAAYEEGLKIAEQQGDLELQSVALGNLGTVALEEEEYTEAKTRFKAALEINKILGGVEGESFSLYQLGTVAAKQKEWTEAEQYHLKSMTIDEHTDNVTGIVNNCNQLAIVAESTGHYVEAGNWYKRALEVTVRSESDGRQHAVILNNLANLLLDEVRAGRALKNSLAEAKNYAEQALAIKRNLEASEGVWLPLGILAEIAELDGQLEKAQDYRRRSREAYAAFPGNRYHIDQQFNNTIAAIVAVAEGYTELQDAVLEELMDLEAIGWHITTAVLNIWVGERNWHSLVEDLDLDSALMVLRILEELEESKEDEAKYETPEQALAVLPTNILTAWKQGDQAAFDQALKVLSPEEQQEVVEAILYLQSQQMEAFLQAIAHIADGKLAEQAAVEEALDRLEKQGIHLNVAVHRIWAGERDAGLLTEELNEQEKDLVQRLLEIIEESSKS